MPFSLPGSLPLPALTCLRNLMMDHSLLGVPLHSAVIHAMSEFPDLQILAGALRVPWQGVLSRDLWYVIHETEKFIFFLLLCVTLAEKKKVSQGWGLNIFWFLFCVLIVFSMSKLLPTGSQIHLCERKGCRAGRHGVWSSALGVCGRTQNMADAEQEIPHPFQRGLPLSWLMFCYWRISNACPFFKMSSSPGSSFSHQVSSLPWTHQISLPFILKHTWFLGCRSGYKFKLQPLEQQYKFIYLLVPLF